PQHAQEGRPGSAPGNQDRPASQENPRRRLDNLEDRGRYLPELRPGRVLLHHQARDIRRARRGHQGPGQVLAGNRGTSTRGQGGLKWSANPPACCWSKTTKTITSSPVNCSRKSRPARFT